MLREHPLDNRAAPVQAPSQVQPSDEQMFQPPAEPDPVFKAEPAKGPEVKLPEEPSKENAESLEIILRLPITGKRIPRRFMKSDCLSLVYDFVDHLQNEKTCTFEGTEGYTSNYQLMTTMPRKVYTEKSKTLEELGFFPRGGMLVI